ncbi:hypothetical protein [Paraburkholderia sp. A3RO-2L]|uniref:hypothetical protein n=1 Tax=Paraburkholderia sp. A3RO-2L TaxID=3028376 RepID=UPI003DA96D4C
MEDIMSNTLRTRITHCITQPTPAQVVSLFMALLVGLIFLSMGGQILWAAGGTWLVESLNAWLSLIFCPDVLGGPGMLVRHFPILTGALGVLWSFHLARRARAGAVPGLSKWDVFFFGDALFFLVTYFVYLGDILTYLSGFVAYVALYSTVAVLAFCTTHVVVCLEEVSESDFSPGGVYGVVVIAAILGTGMLARLGFALTFQAVILHLVSVVLGAFAYASFRDAAIAQRLRSVGRDASCETGA